MSQELGSFLRRRRPTILQRWQLQVAALTQTLNISRIEPVVVEVADDCGGIVDGNWASIFEPYERGAEAAKRQREGLGLGLAIAKEAAEAHGGTLAVRNVADGCVFELRLPHRPPS